MKSLRKMISIALIGGTLLAAAGISEAAFSVGLNIINGNNNTSMSYVTSYASTSSQKKAAKKLIGKTCTRKYIQNKVGKPKRFVMSNAGCERGVYAGNFYYKKFTIHTRTYNKGKTFRVVSVN
jgi:hypothetical protein